MWFCGGASLQKELVYPMVISASVYASQFGVTPSVDMKIDIVKDVYLFLATSYIGHSMQANGFAGRLQLTAKVFDNQYTKILFLDSSVVHRITKIMAKLMQFWNLHLELLEV